MKECLYIPTLETERLILRKLVPEDADDLRRWLGLDIVYKYWGHSANWNEKNPELLFIDPRPQIKRKPSHDFIWGIVCREDGRVIGIMEIFNVQGDRIGSVAYRISPEYWDKGYCTEALGRTVQFIFSETSLERLSAEADIDNASSNAILLKCGFTHEGCVRKGKMGSRYCSYNIYGYIREDYEKSGGEQYGFEAGSEKFEVRQLREGAAGDIKRLFVKIFSGQPWNDNWSDDDQLRLYIDELIGQKNSLTFGAFAGGSLIALSMGQVRHWYEGTEYFINEFCVASERQGQRIGSLFMSEIEKACRDMGIVQLYLLTGKDAPAYGFYKKQGFEHCESTAAMGKRL